LGSTTDAWAYTFRGDEVSGSHLIILSDSLWDQPDEDIIYTVAHEIGHVILGHKNAILEPQSEAQVAKQEKEAREYALKYL
jgi:Zn-dependent peptidase ImmA (M78 family)